MPRDVVVRGVLVTLMLSAPLARAQDVEAGRRVFAGRCANCHGTEGAGGEAGPVNRRTRAPAQRSGSRGRDSRGRPGFGDAGLSARSRGLKPADLVRVPADAAAARRRRTASRKRDARRRPDPRGLVLNQSHGDMQLLGDDRACTCFARPATDGTAQVTSQTDWPSYNGQTERQPLQPAHADHRPRNVAPPGAEMDLHACRTPRSCR